MLINPPPLLEPQVRGHKPRGAERAIAVGQRRPHPRIAEPDQISAMHRVRQPLEWHPMRMKGLARRSGDPGRAYSASLAETRSGGEGEPGGVALVSPTPMAVKLPRIRTWRWVDQLVPGNPVAQRAAALRSQLAPGRTARPTAAPPPASPPSL